MYSSSNIANKKPNRYGRNSFEINKKRVRKLDNEQSFVSSISIFVACNLISRNNHWRNF